MKRFILTMTTLLLFGAGGAWAEEIGVGVGVFGGLSWPVLQDVSTSSFSPGEAFGENGSQFGIRVPVTGIPVVTLEPYYSNASYGERTETFNGISYTREGFDGTSFGLNAILGKIDSPGVKFYPYVGLGSYSLDRTGEEIDDIGFNFGLGLGFHVATKVTLQVRGEFDMVATGDTSRKFTNATLGVNYHLKP